MSAAELNERAEALAVLARINTRQLYRTIDPETLTFDDPASFELAVAQARLDAVKAKLAEARAAHGYHEAVRPRPLHALDRFVGGRFNLQRLTATTADTPEALEDLRSRRGQVNEAE